MTFKFNARQVEAQAVLSGPAMHVLLYGGARSGKTFLILRSMVFRALKAPNSRHVAFRFRLNHIVASVVLDTFPKVMRLCFPGVRFVLNQSSYFARFDNGSELWFGGLDDRERTEKILGMEFATLFFNEGSQIPHGSVTLALTRLAQLVHTDVEGASPVPLKLRAYYDANPPPRSHWLYRKFVQKLDPETREALPSGHMYDAFQINPQDNAENLSPEFLDTLRGLPTRQQRRFLLGEFADATPNALFPEENIDRFRVTDGIVPDLIRVVVAVDPSGASDDSGENDAIGIIVAGLGVDGNAYVLEDLTVRASPAVWGAVATSAYERNRADIVVAEGNFGGAMVEQTIRVARPGTPYKQITSSRGKVLRAEPFSSLYEVGKVRHVGMFLDLEEELSGFSTTGFTGGRSPNRADALVFALAELFPAMTRTPETKLDMSQTPAHELSWMIV